MNADPQVLAPASIDALAQALQAEGYFADRRLATAAWLALKLQRPLLLEGEPGVGKTALAQALARALGRPLIRLQCYDGLEQREALYEWIYQERYLVSRPLLQALRTPAPGALLLVDEIDRADEPFEAFLLEYLGEYQVSIPELGTVRAVVPPVTLLTSNRTRDLHDAVKRRCLYHWLDYPDRERELAIVRSQVPGASSALSEQVADFVARLRSQPFANAFQRAPGIAEAVEWAKALVALDTLVVDPEVVQDTAGNAPRGQPARRRPARQVCRQPQWLRPRAAPCRCPGGRRPHGAGAGGRHARRLGACRPVRRAGDRARHP